MRGRDRGAAVFASDRAAIILLHRCFAMLASRAPALRNFCINGDLSKGSANQPDNWRTEAWVNEPSAVTFHWTHPPNGGPGELEVNALKANDARWMQSLSLTPGWYYISADIRTENVGAQNSGATISVMEDGIMSPEVKGTSDWTRVGLYMRVGSKGADVEVALRVGGFGSLNTGQGIFSQRQRDRGRLLRRPARQPIFDLETIRKAARAGADRKTLSLVLTYLLLIDDRLRGMVRVRAGAAQGHARGGAPRSEEGGARR